MSARAERQLLAQMVAGLDVEPAMRVRPEHFAKVADRQIWKAGLALMDGGREVTILGLEEELRRMGCGTAHLDTVAQYPLDFTTDADVEEAADTVLTASLRRRAVALCRQAADDLEASQDPREEISSLVESLAALGSTGDSDGRLSLYDAMRDKVAEIKAEADGLRPRASTGIRGLDDKIGGGFGAGWQVVVGARPKMGKSAFALQVATAIAKGGGPVIFFSHEMSSTEIGGRSFANMGGLDIARMGKQESDWSTMYRVAEEARKLEFSIVDRPLEIRELISIALRWRREHHEGLGLIVVDYLQLVEGAKDATREQEVAGISRRCKLLARQTGCVVMALSQLNRGLESRDNKRPRLSDLRESGSIEQDADLVLFLYRPRVYYPDKTIEPDEIGIEAFRHGGSPEKVLVRFNPKMTRFEDV